jgi:hypothetical protein
MKTAYLLLCVLGVVVPYFAFGPWLLEHGPALYLLVTQVLGSPVAAFAWADVLVSAVALLVFMAHEQRSRPIRYSWLPVVGLLCVGVSLALPLYLYMRENSGGSAA